jgi:hypothetical protein
MAFKAGYAVGGFRGPELFLDGATLGQAVGEASDFFSDSRIYFDGDLDEVVEEERDLVVPNVPQRRTRPSLALKNSGLRRMDVNAVMGLSTRQAHCRIAGYFKHLDGCPIQAYGESSAMARRFLGENAKLRKGRWAKLPRGAHRGISRGLALMPHNKAARFSNLPLPMKGLGLCAGSSPECRDLCLLYSGQNPTGDKAGPAKLRKTEALLMDPVAFMRMMVYAAKVHHNNCRKQNMVAYLRLNVLSDIPWELVLPEYFELVRPVRCYDYTKVEGRRQLDNYDLTFSFNGRNWDACERELKRGVRVCVVFWHDDKKTKVTDFSFRGHPVVVNGDPYDFRPLDPPGVLVGLTYRPPRLDGKYVAEPPPRYRKFVVPAFFDTDTGATLVPQTPASTGAALQFRHADPKRLS